MRLDLPRRTPVVAIMGASKSALLKLTIRPLTPELWPSLEDLFGKNGACGGCWCMYPRIGSAYTKRPGEENRRDFSEVVRRGPAPGLLAFAGDLAVGWCQITPRDAAPWLDRTWRLASRGRCAGVVDLVPLRAQGLSAEGHHVRARCRCREDRHAREGAGR